MTTEMLEGSGIMECEERVSGLQCDFADGVANEGQLLFCESQSGGQIESTLRDVLGDRERCLGLWVQTEERLAVARVKEVARIHSFISEPLSEGIFGHPERIFDQYSVHPVDVRCVVFRDRQPEPLYRREFLLVAPAHPLFLFYVFRNVRHLTD